MGARTFCGTIQDATSAECTYLVDLFPPAAESIVLDTHCSIHCNPCPEDGCVSELCRVGTGFVSLTRWGLWSCVSTPSTRKTSRYWSRHLKARCKSLG